VNGECRPEGRKPGRAFVNGCSEDHRCYRTSSGSTAVPVGRVRALRCLTISWSSSLAWVTLAELLVAVVLRRGIAVL
jgi:hypothetical protein